MKSRILLVITYVLLLFSCSESHKRPCFDVIDFSYYNGWDSFYSMKAYRNGEVSVLKENRNKTFIQTHLSAEIVDSISSLLNKIDFYILDSLYEENCVDCEYYCLLIKEQNKHLKLFVEGNNNNQSLMAVNNLKTYLISISKDLLEKTDSIRFESKTLEFYPIPPPILMN